MDVTGKEKNLCKEQNHDLDYDHNWDNKTIDNSKDVQLKECPDRSKTEKLIEFVKLHLVKIVISANDSSKVFCLVKIQGHYETIEIGTDHALSWLKAAYYDQSRELLSDDAYERVLRLIRAKALQNKRIKKMPIYKRTALCNDEIYYDLGRQDWKMVKITREQVRIVDYDKDLPMFKRSKNQTGQPDPHLNFDGNPLDEFCKLLRIDSLVFKAHLASFFIENVPIPQMVILGQQGSIKSTQTGLIKMVVDPAGEKIDDNLSHLPRNNDDLSIILSNSYLVAFDNVSYISHEVSDLFCKAITGASYQKRRLYTDEDVISIYYRRKIVINGISLSLDRGDLVERSIEYNTQKVPEDERKTIRDVERSFQILLPDLLGQIFVILQKSLRLYPDVHNKTKCLPRMADFALWCESISQALGNEEGKFLSQYRRELDKNNEILNENNPLLPYLEQILSENSEVLLPMSSFFQTFKKYAESNQYDTGDTNFPKHANKIRGFITRSKPLLDEAAITIEFFKNVRAGTGFTKNQTLVRVRKASSPSSPSSPMDMFVENQSKNGEHGEDTQHHLGDDTK